MNSPVNHPSELAGKSVTVHRYNATTPVWLRGILQNEFVVKPSDLEWYVAEPDIAEESLKPPLPEVRVRFIPSPRTREHAVEMVEEGKIEAALEPYHLHDNAKMLSHEGLSPSRETILPSHRRLHTQPPFCIARRNPPAHPFAVKNLFAALKEANSLADQYRDEKQKDEAAWEKEVMGEEFSYSLKQGCARRSLETLMEYQVQQGILDKIPDIEELFFPETLDV